MDAREKKRVLRREILAQRNRLKPEEKEKMDRQILKRLLDWEPLWTGRPVHLLLLLRFQTVSLCQNLPAQHSLFFPGVHGL